jgi:hypothetical protein
MAVVVDVGPDVEDVNVGDICSVPFNIVGGGVSGPAPRAGQSGRDSRSGA